MNDNAGRGRDNARLFVAIFPPRAVVESLMEAVRPFRGEFGGRAIRWTVPEQVHFTLVFIGSVDRERIPEFERALETAAAIREGGMLRAVGVGCFPNSARARVVWAGLAGDLEPVRELKVTLDRALEPLGVVPEEREFRPHLTLGRVNQLGGRDRIALEKMLDNLGEREFGAWQWDRVDLMESVLGSAGARYRVLKSCSIKARVPEHG